MQSCVELAGAVAEAVDEVGPGSDARGEDEEGRAEPGEGILLAERGEDIAKEQRADKRRCYCENEVRELVPAQLALGERGEARDLFLLFNRLGLDTGTIPRLAGSSAEVELPRDCAYSQSFWTVRRAGNVVDVLSMIWCK